MKTAWLVAAALLGMVGSAHAIGPVYGVQTDVPVASLTGWTLCYTDTYANSSTSLASIQAACSQEHLLLGCRPVGSPDLQVAAHAPRADVLFDTGTSDTPHNANGVGWYYSSSYSWGFAPEGDPINRSSCDTAGSAWGAGPHPDGRLCWHTGGGNIDGGWRCGADIELNGAGGWERLVFQRQSFCNHDGVFDDGEECDDENTDDGDGCSECFIDTCWNCSGEPSVCIPSIAGTPCPADEVFCTDDACNGLGACEHPDKTAGTPCDDGDACTQTDTCQAGACVGDDLFVCCNGGECVPESGLCSTCPYGYEAVEGGCRKTYRIDTDAELDNLPATCEPNERYNDCDGAYGFHWTDEGDAAVGAVLEVTIRLEAGITCAAGSRPVSLNATPIGTFDTAGDCTCGSPHASVVLEVADVAPYVKGGANAVVTADPGDCEGLTQDDDGNYAVVEVTYEAYPVEPIDCDDAEACTQDSCVDGDGCIHAEEPLDADSCLAALASKLQVKDSVTPAKDRLSWQWGKGEQFDQALLGAPLASTAYTLCVYDRSASASSLKASIGIDPSPALWTDKDPKGLAYKDKLATSDGVTKAQVKTGAATRTKVKVAAAGVNLSLPGAVDADTYIAPDAEVVVQLVHDDGACWTSEFLPEHVKKNDAGQFKAQVK